MTSDDISFISIKNQTQDFPSHFHETFCISFIKSGIEKIEMGKTFFYSPENTISITNPYETHANPLWDKDAKVSFDTIYISTELMSFFFKKQDIEFGVRQIRDHQINHAFATLFEYLKSGQERKLYSLLKNFSCLVLPHTKAISDDRKPSFPSEYLSELITFIETNLDNKIYPDELARVLCMNKYSFIKRFKSLTAMTPMSYVMMKKIFTAKAQFTTDCNITDIAYYYNFTDIAHFSHAFKKYIGLSPKEYRELLGK